MNIVTRFGEISPLWQAFQSLGNFWYGFNSIWQTFVPTLAIFIVAKGKRLKNNIAIGSYC